MLNMLGCDYLGRLTRMREGIPFRSVRDVSPIPVVVVVYAASSLMKILALVLPQSDVVVSLRNLAGQAPAEVFDRTVAGLGQLATARVVL
jgi:hypothetical protein